MKNLFNFILKVNKLKTIPRTGLVWLEVKNPPTITDHIFRSALTSWLLGEKDNLNTERLIKIAFSHDLGEVYSGDMTPFWNLLPKDKKKRKEALKRWIRLPIKEKEKRNKKEFEIEKKSLLKLIKPLETELKEEIFSCWLDHKKGCTAAGRFFKQTDKMDSMIEALEYLDKKEYSFVIPWWEEANELIVNPLLKLLLKTIENKFYDTKVKVSNNLYDKKTKREIRNILDFILETGKLKKMPRRIWVSLGVQNPEMVASHIFSLTLLVWILGRKKKELSMEKLLKMALCHELSAVYTGDLITPYSRVLPKTKKEIKKVFEKWPRLFQKEKQKKFKQDYKKERNAFQKLTQKLPTSLKKEMIQLFDEYKTLSSPEARFLNQLNVLVVLLEGIQYKKEDPSISIDWLWEWTYEKCDNSLCLDFIEELKKRFY